MLAVLVVAQLAIAFAARGVVVLAPFLQSEFQLAKAQIGMLSSSLFVGQMVGAIPAGAQVDRLGVRRMLLLSTAGVGVCLLIMALSPTWTLVLLGMTLAGIAYTAMHSVTNKGLLEWFSRERRGLAVGIKQTGITNGAAIAALVLPALALAMSWRSAMALTAVGLVLLGAVCAIAYRTPKGRGTQQQSAASEGGAASLRQVMGNTRLRAVSLTALILGLVQFSVYTYLILYLGDELGYPLVAAGAMLSLSEISGSGGKLGWGWASDRIFGGRRQPALRALAGFGALGLFLLSLAGGRGVGCAVFPLLVLVGATTGGYNGLWMNLASESAPPHLAGMATGLSITLGSLGSALGPPLFGLVVDLTGSYALAWQILAGVLVGLWLALRYVRLENQ